MRTLTKRQTPPDFEIYCAICHTPLYSSGASIILLHIKDFHLDLCHQCADSIIFYITSLLSPYETGHQLPNK